MDDFEYCGNCPVCSEDVEHSEAGFCNSCGQAFHWGECGTWRGNEHKCLECYPDEEEE